ncbi:hypothetical protein [Krasilnikovia sp. M28-CT-15]
MIFGALGAVVLGLILGFVTGGLLYRQSRQWCPSCGASTERPDPPRRSN